ncbi:MAG: M67 family metallopeptidase [Candidatus Heimdallarchaeota archaeon]|nr:M67 family metallopeptidase [Candidatus Heimdallarchaeota archaeon]
MDQLETLILPETILAKLIAHATNSQPYESVALLAGVIKDTIAYVTKVYTPKNIDYSPYSFTVDSFELLSIYTDIESNKLELVAIYHTHPAPAKPSGMDLYYMEVNSCVWLISNISKPGKPNGYLLLQDGTLKTVTVKIVKQ